MDDLKILFTKHLAAAGYEPDLPKHVIAQKLRQRMGEQRFKEFEGIMSAQRTTSNQEEMYKLFEDLVEGNLMRSLDPGALMDASFHLYQQCLPRLTPGTRVIELGCWTGGLASFIAARHPECTVVGVDLSQGVIDACNVYYQLPNLSFCRWNYKFAKPEHLERADLLLCSMGVSHTAADDKSLPDPEAIRRSSEYIHQRDQAIGYFGMWRMAAKDDALLFAVLRLRMFPRFLAWIDAAQATGWTVQLESLAHVNLRDYQIPSFQFQARQSKPLHEDEAISAFCWFTCRGHIYVRMTEFPALIGFRLLNGKCELGRREYRMNGILTRDQIGMAGAVGYVFTDDSTCKYRLLLTSPLRAKELATAIGSKRASLLPITDDGQFQNSGTSMWSTGSAGGQAFQNGGSPFAQGPVQDTYKFDLET